MNIWILSRKEAGMKKFSELALSVWNEAKTNAFGRHNEGFLLAYDIARNDRRVVGNTPERIAFRAEIQELYRASLTPSVPVGRKRYVRRKRDQGGLKKAANFLPKKLTSRKR